MKVALVHDDFVQEGGAENLFAEICGIYKDAPIYTSLVNWQKLPKSIDKNRLHPSFMQKIPFAAKFYKLLLPLYPLAFESFDLSNFDLVISSTTRFAKGIVTPAKTVHICYINSAPRFLWHAQHKSNYLSSPLEFVTRPLINWLKRWDISAAARVDFFIANSQNVAASVKEIYGQNAQVVYPFADTDFFTPAKIHNWRLKSQNYYLLVSRLVRWKKIEIAVKAANNLPVNLFIVGTGPDKSRLENLAARYKIQGTKYKIEFLGKVSKEKLKELYQNAKALIVTQDEDFGVATVEAQACGIPTVAYEGGGQKEIVKNGLTGLFFSSQGAKSLQDAINSSSAVKWNLQQIRNNALKFSRARFGNQLKDLIARYVHQSKNSN